jgi:mono/diheme cytochrome c family protein
VSTVAKTLLGLVLIVVVAACAVALSIIGRGISAKSQPTWVETQIAGTMRHLAIPRGARERTNPVPRTPESIREGLEHFADHCATCHANNGSGDVEIGRNLYPKPPDMRHAPTQSLSDGELFFIIENGVRLTGMPAWSTGTADGERASWHLVNFIRHLPKITREEIARMEQLNPKSPDEMREEQEMRQFLEGESPPAQSKPSHTHPGGDHD